MRQSFDDIATRFDNLFENADQLTDLEGQALDNVLKPYGASSVLDCAAGTGIQSIGLARLGYKVSASDISPRMVKVLAAKAATENLAVEVQQADFRTLKPWQGRVFDAVVCSGNSITLLKNEKDMRKSLQCMLKCVKKPGGALVIGMHNYIALRQAGENMIVRKLKILDGACDLVVDIRLFGADRAQVTNFFISNVSGRWTTKTFTKSYYLLPPDDLRQFMLDAGCRAANLFDVSGQRAYNNEEWVLAVGSVS